MTAPDLQSLIAGVLAEHWTFTTHGDFDALLDRCDGCHADIYTHGHATDQKTALSAHQARAVLAALTEAGNVEWGMQSKTFIDGDWDRVWTKDPDSGKPFTERKARNHLWLKSPIPFRLVSRLTLPWTKVQ